MSELSDRREKLRRDARRESLVVFVWGPGDPGPDADDFSKAVWSKRNQIRASLAESFPNAEVLFSEDDEGSGGIPLGKGEVLASELESAAVADCIVILDGTRGASVEVDLFHLYPSIARKMCVFIPERFVGKGLVTEVYERVRLESYTPEDLAECNVAKRVDGVVLQAALQRRLGGS